jgi:4-hydroxy-tetrahydrodipicolinate synthase
VNYLKKQLFEGSAVALVTPMRDDGKINYETFEKLIEFQIKNGTNAIVVCGTTGESSTLNLEERNEIINFAVKKTRKKIPVIAGVGSNNTKTALEYAINAENSGVDGLLIVTPYYNKTSQSGLIKHYRCIAEKTNLPIILYNVPSRTGVNIKPETYVELAKHPRIYAVKEANGDISSVAKTIFLCKENLAVYSGNDDQTVPILSLGGIGVISTFANICPKESAEISNAFLNGEVKKSVELHLKFIDLMEALFCDINPIPVKAALNMMGYLCGNCRMPLDILSEENKNFIKKIMKNHEII